MKMAKRAIYVVVKAIIALLLIVSPVYAIVNPDSIDFGTGTVPLYRVFYNVVETGDMLFVAEGYVHYVVTPSDYTAEEAFLFEILNVAGTDVLISTSLNQYENRPISIYQTAAQVTALGITVGDAIGFRITGNPAIFAAPAGNTVTAFLSPDQYIYQLLGVDGGIATANPLRNFLIGMAENIEDNDSPPVGGEYIVVVQGVRYLTLDGGDIFIEGIPGLSTFCQIVFQAGVEPMESDAPESAGTYTSELTPLARWGQTVSEGLTNLGTYLGISQALAGSVVMLGFVMAFAIYVYKRTQSGVAMLLLVSATPFLGSWLGLMPLALAFIFAIGVVILVGYFFFSRGAL